MSYLRNTQYNILPMIGKAEGKLIWTHMKLWEPIEKLPNIWQNQYSKTDRDYWKKQERGS